MHHAEQVFDDDILFLRENRDGRGSHEGIDPVAFEDRLSVYKD
jgi:hypothetical protein